MQQEQHSDALPHPPTFDQMVGMIKKLFTDSLEQTKMFTAEEIEAGWERYKALNHLYLAEPGGQSAGTWVKASERTPDNDDVLHVKIDGIRYMGNFFDAELPGEKGFYVQSNGAHEGWIIEQHKFSGILWLDEAALPDNKDREKQAIGLLTSLCDLKQYKDTTGKDEYYEENKERAWDNAFKFLESLTNKQ